MIWNAKRRDAELQISLERPYLVAITKVFVVTLKVFLYYFFSFPKVNLTITGKPAFAEYVANSFKESNNFNVQECYLIGDFNVNLLSWKKLLLKKPCSDSYSQVPPLV